MSYLPPGTHITQLSAEDIDRAFKRALGDVKRGNLPSILGRTLHSYIDSLFDLTFIVDNTFKVAVPDDPLFYALEKAKHEQHLRKLRVESTWKCTSQQGQPKRKIQPNRGPVGSKDWH